MNPEFKIPRGYRLIPEDLYQAVFAKIGWNEIIEPTISQVAGHLGISTDKIKADLYKNDCPLHVTHKGGRGRRNEKRFLKVSVDEYKKWINKKKGCTNNPGNN